MFVNDEEHRRTFDDNRGLELFCLGSGSDGTTNFKIVGSGAEYVFSATSYGEKLPPEDVTRIGHDYGGDYVVWRVHNWNEQWKPIIKEALLTYRARHGNVAPGMATFIRWGSDRVLDN